MKTLLSELTESQTLDQQKARKVLHALASGIYNSSEISAFMTVYMMRAITLEELEGFRDAMLDLCVAVQFDRPVMDVCGTGGDGKSTFNISTIASFIVAGAGQPVAKHGNYGVSSVCGSSNVLEYLGYHFTNKEESLKRSLNRSNIAFLHAPLFHPAMKQVGPVRKELGVKTFFNMLGPMVNPARPEIQMAGVFSLELARQYGYLYQKTDKSFVIVHDLAGYDEISLTGAAKLFSNTGEGILEPSDLGLQEVRPSSLAGALSVEESAGLFLQILAGKGTKDQTDVVVANAGLALHCAGKASSLESAVELARESLDSGLAEAAFVSLLNGQ